MTSAVMPARLNWFWIWRGLMYIGPSASNFQVRLLVSFFLMRPQTAYAVSRVITVHRPGPDLSPMLQHQRCTDAESQQENHQPTSQPEPEPQQAAYLQVDSARIQTLRPGSLQEGSRGGS